MNASEAAPVKTSGELAVVLTNDFDFQHGGFLLVFYDNYI